MVAISIVVADKSPQSMNTSASEQSSDGALLSAAVKRVRLRRGLTAQAVANRMNVTLRTYERFEAGRMRLNPDLIRRFARATDSDPHALWMGLVIGSPDFALHSADNQFATVLLSATHKFEARMGERIARLSTRTIIDAVMAMYDGLAQQAEDQSAEQWLHESKRELAAARPKPGR
ncbi:MAG: helix-turn-helix domain-containing protein [Brevundimonas sp.]